jgi:hypothetical protein
MAATTVHRRAFLRLIAAATALPWEDALGEAAPYPREVAGVLLPRTPLAAKAYELCRSSAPPFLLNHSMRTYVFGALQAEHDQHPFDAESAFVAAALHDLGLLPAFATKSGSFEIDGADRAERLVREAGGSAREAQRVWNAIVMHDMRYAMASHQSPEAMLVASGAGADVIGPDDSSTSPARVREVLAAFPRLEFKTRFTTLLVEHCERKPEAQRATWLESFCREHNPNPARSNLEEAIRKAPFAE